MSFDQQENRDTQGFQLDTLSHATSGALTGAVAAELMLPTASTSLICIGLIAGLIPDIDFLAELKGKVAAWTMHRIVAHNIPVALLLATVLGLVVWSATALPLPVVLIVCISAATIHLLLDVLTSFGTCLLYPFNTTRFTTRSHFIFDPVVILICGFGLLSTSPVRWMAALLIYLSFGIIVRYALTAWYSSRHSDLGSNRLAHLEPRFLAPFRWLIILQKDDGYRYAYQNLLWRGPWHEQKHHISGHYDQRHLDKVITACQNDELLSAVLVTFDMPVYTLVNEQRSLYVLVEDLKWRLEPQLRPLVFTALVTMDSTGEVVLEQVKQGGFFQSGKTGLFRTVSCSHST